MFSIEESLSENILLQPEDTSDGVFAKGIIFVLSFRFSLLCQTVQGYYLDQCLCAGIVLKFKDDISVSQLLL